MKTYPDVRGEGKDLRISEPLWTRRDDSDFSPIGETVPQPPAGDGGAQPLDRLPEGLDADSPETEAHEDTGAFIALLQDFAAMGYTATVKRHALLLVKVTPPTSQDGHWTTQMWHKGAGETGLRYVLGFGWTEFKSLRAALHNRYAGMGVLS